MRNLLTFIEANIIICGCGSKNNRGNVAIAIAADKVKRLLFIYSKSQAEDNLMEYLGNSDIDAISFTGFSALRMPFQFKVENSYTLLSHKIIVRKFDYSPYYLNLNFNHTRNPNSKIGEDIIDSFKFFRLYGCSDSYISIVISLCYICSLKALTLQI